MSDRPLSAQVDALLASYRSDPRGHRINRRFLPSRDEIIRCTRMFLELLYPGYFGRQDITDANVGYHVGVVLSELRGVLAKQIELCLCFAKEDVGGCMEGCANEASRRADAVLDGLPILREKLLRDIRAAFDGDPAAGSMDEVILAYPGLLAVTVYRIAHELFLLEVPMMPRIMSEWAHTQTGADIHPGASIGESFFVDHATGIVVGETSRLGAHVKLYQGVTLGALSIRKDSHGRAIRGTQRHPTVQDGVTIYANATVLGGETVIGEGAVVGGSVFVTRSVPPGARVAMKSPELAVRGGVDDRMIDFEI
ncbi:MAG: serine acetyltransferase [Deltaproteobacteria bacterium]|nr:serine acetyltransferase [Deltaproteobacteria bacterium]